MVDGCRAVSGSSDGTLRVWDLETGKTLAVVTLDAPVRAVAVSPDGRIVLVGDQAGKVHFLDLVEPKQSSSTETRVPPTSSGAEISNQN